MILIQGDSCFDSCFDVGADSHDHPAGGYLLVVVYVRWVEGLVYLIDIKKKFISTKNWRRKKRDMPSRPNVASALVVRLGMWCACLISAVPWLGADPDGGVLVIAAVCVVAVIKGVELDEEGGDGGDVVVTGDLLELDKVGLLGRRRKTLRVLFAGGIG